MTLVALEEVVDGCAILLVLESLSGIDLVLALWDVVAAATAHQLAQGRDAHLQSGW
jgi:hypothetical protein